MSLFLGKQRLAWYLVSIVTLIGVRPGAWRVDCEGQSIDWSCHTVTLDPEAGQSAVLRFECEGTWRAEHGAGLIPHGCGAEER